MLPRVNLLTYQNILKKKRLVWVGQSFELLTNEMSSLTYIDGKWFYTTNHRRQVRRLPLIPVKAEGVDHCSLQKVRSRRILVKAMFMGSVGRPIPVREFDGRVLHLERVSKPMEVKN